MLVLLMLQVFKTEKRGWGIRTLHDIPQVVVEVVAVVAVTLTPHPGELYLCLRGQFV